MHYGHDAIVISVRCSLSMHPYNLPRCVCLVVSDVLVGGYDRFAIYLRPHVCDVDFSPAKVSGLSSAQSMPGGCDV